MSEETGRRRALFEVAAVLVGGAINVLAETVGPFKGPFVVLTAAAWLAYLLNRARSEAGLWRAWGFRRDTLAPAMKEASLVAVAALALLVPLGLRLGHFPPPPSFWATAALYPAWGLAQQFLLNALLARNLRPFLGDRATVLTAAALFSLAHAPDWPLMGLTFAIGLPWVRLYQRRPNLWVLGFWHGVLGAVAWYGALGRDALTALNG